MGSTVDRQFVKGGATTIILNLLDESPMHGYEIVQTIRERTRGIFEFGDGTIYPLLYLLREKGLVDATEATSPEGRLRKIYRLTPRGRAALERQKADWRLFVRGMNLALGTRV
jgi:DNA-binding PadR family transcriptional regulator